MRTTPHLRYRKSNAIQRPKWGSGSTPEDPVPLFISVNSAALRGHSRFTRRPLLLTCSPIPGSRLLSSLFWAGNILLPNSLGNLDGAEVQVNVFPPRTLDLRNREGAGS